MDLIEVLKGDSLRVNLIFSGSLGPLNLSGYGIRFLASQNYDSPPVVDIINTGHDSFESGLSHILITSGESSFCPADYIYSLKLFNLQNNQYSSFDEGIYRISPNL